MILGVLPLVAFCLALLVLGSMGGWRAALIKAGVAWGLCVVLNTELLSLFSAIRFPWLSAAWAVECCVAIFGIWWRRTELGEQLRRLRMKPLPCPYLVALAPVALIAIATGITAWVAPPNTWDSMTYHLAKVAHWAADGTVTNYPTNIVWQLIYAPFSEFAVLQFQVLSGGDQFANLVQWFSMIGSLVGVSLIAQQLGAPPRGQVLAVIVTATLTMGILQASSTQTDYVVAFWLVCCVFLALEFVVRPTPQAAAWFACGLGLAFLTKGNAYFFAVPLVLLLGLWMLTRLRWRVITPALLMIVIPLAINAGFYIRNETLFGNPLAANQKLAALMIVGRISPRTVASNLVRDTAVQFGTPDPTVNHWIERAVTKLHSQVLHIGLNDPNTTYPAAFQVTPLSFDEDYAGDPLHSILAIAAVLAAIALALWRGPPLPGLYAAGLVLAFVMFAAYLKWQPWHPRLELPLLVLSAPLIGVLVSRFSGAGVAATLSTVLIVASVPWIVDNQTRPLIDLGLPTPSGLEARSLAAGGTIFNTPRTDLYFVEAKSLEAPYVSAVARAAQIGCGEIGLWNGFDDWEYPLWALAQQSGHSIRVDQVFIQNESVNASRFGSKPCLIVAVVPDQPTTVTLDGVVFVRTSVAGGSTAVGLYEPT